MIFNNDEEALISNIEKSLETIEDPKRRIKIAQRISGWAEQSLKEVIKKRRRDAYQQKRINEEIIRPQFQLITKLSLGSGDLIRLKGTRDYGVREIINLDGNKVVCYQLWFSNSLDWKKQSAYLASYRRSGIKTTHDLTKITHVSENGEWKDFKREWFLKKD